MSHPIPATIHVAFRVLVTKYQEEEVGLTHDNVYATRTHHERFETRREAEAFVQQLLESEETKKHNRVWAHTGKVVRAEVKQLEYVRTQYGEFELGRKIS